MEPIAYTYEASEHCPECTEKRFGATYTAGVYPKIETFATYEEAEAEHGYAHGPFIALGAKDNEGNEVGAVAPWEAFEDRDMVCGTCDVVIHEMPAPYDRSTGDVDSKLDPWSMNFNSDSQDVEIEEVVDRTLKLLAVRGFPLPSSVDTTNLTNALLEIVGTYNQGQRYEVYNPQWEGDS